jgi:hypothetical protein
LEQLVITNTGGGGGGGSAVAGVSGGTGGSGIVIVRYTGSQFATGGTVNPSSCSRIYNTYLYWTRNIYN